MRVTRNPSGGSNLYSVGTPQPARTGPGEWLKARKGKVAITVLLVGGLAFAAGWNPPTDTVHSFTQASDYSTRRESGCTNSGDGCHGFDEGLTDFNAYHPDTACTVCHEYTGVGCIPCHSPNQHECTGCHDGSMEGASDCVTLTDAWPKGHYREALHTALGTDFDREVRTAATGEAKATCADCHARDLQTVHADVNEVEGSDYGTEIGCAECHNDKQSGALDQVLSDWEDHRCEDCHGEDARAAMHPADVVTGSIEASSAVGCGDTGAGCHEGNDLHGLHPDAPATCSGSAADGEPGCHVEQADDDTAVATSCGTGGGACHPAYVNDRYSHSEDTTAHATATGTQAAAVYRDTASGVSTTCGSCHTTDIGIEHARPNSAIADDRCFGCHNASDATVAAVRDDWSVRETADACAACHGAAIHGAIGSAHTATQIGHDGTVSATGCVRPGCHATADVRILHAGIGCTISGCHSNTGDIRGLRTMTCGGESGEAACHTADDALKHDDFAAVHAGVEYSRDNLPVPGSCAKDGCHLTTNIYEGHHEVGCAITGCHVEGGPTGQVGCGGNAENGALSCHLRGISYHTENPNHHIGIEYADDNTPTPGTCVQAGCHTTTRLSTLHEEGGGCYGTPGCHVKGGPSMVIGCGGSDSSLSCHTAGFADTHEPVHVPVVPASEDTTNTACVNSACHGPDLVPAHNGGECSASCHYFEPDWPQACRCHATAVTRPTGPLATTMAEAIANGGAGLVCTTCHGEGHPPHEEDPHVDAAGPGSASCVTADCHGSGVLLDVHAAVGCACHADPDLAATMETLIAAGTAECIDCHIPRETLHEPPHALITPAPTDLTNTACLLSGCHSPSLVTAHNGGECSASCHYFEEPWPQACRCHATAVTRPTGPLATTMAEAIANGGAGLVCTTCHGEGHPPHEETHGDASGVQSSHCTTCHGSSDLPTVMGSCFCHTDPVTAGTIAAFVDAGTYAECLDCHIPADCPDPGAALPVSTSTVTSGPAIEATATAVAEDATETSESVPPAQEPAVDESVKQAPSVPVPECSVDGTTGPDQSVCLACHTLAP